MTMSATETPQIAIYGQKPYEFNAECNPARTNSTTPNKAPIHTI